MLSPAPADVTGSQRNVTLQREDGTTGLSTVEWMLRSAGIGLAAAFRATPLGQQLEAEATAQAVTEARSSLMPVLVVVIVALVAFVFLRKGR